MVLGGVYGEYTTRDQGQRKFAVDIPRAECNLTMVHIIYTMGCTKFTTSGAHDVIANLQDYVTFVWTRPLMVSRTVLLH